MRRSDHPSRPSAITCCRFSALKTLPIPAAGVQPTAQVNVSAPGAALAGFQVSINGRFWVSTEGIERRSPLCSAWLLLWSGHTSGPRQAFESVSTSATTTGAYYPFDVQYRPNGRKLEVAGAGGGPTGLQAASPPAPAPEAERQRSAITIGGIRREPPRPRRACDGSSRGVPRSGRSGG